MKKEIRIIGIDDCPFDRFKDKEVQIIATLFRGGEWLDGVMSTRVEVDGIDATTKIARMINKSRFKPQVQAIMLDGIAFGGFNIVDIHELNKKTDIPVIVVIRKKPDIKRIENVLARINMHEKIEILRRAGELHKIGKVYVQFAGTTHKEVRDLIDVSSTRSHIPEPIRVAHLIGAGLVKGESRGRA